MAELVDALDLGSSGKTRGGSSPPPRTIQFQRPESLPTGSGKALQTARRHHPTCAVPPHDRTGVPHDQEPPVMVRSVVPRRPMSGELGQALPLSPPGTVTPLARKQASR